MGDGMMHYIGKCVKTGQHMVHVNHYSGQTETKYFATQQQADAAIMADWQEERERGILDGIN